MTAAMVERASLVVRRAPRGVLVRGDRVRWDGGQYTVAGLDGTAVCLVSDAGDRTPVSVLLAMLAAAADFADPLPGGGSCVRAHLFRRDRAARGRFGHAGCQAGSRRR